MWLCVCGGGGGLSSDHDNARHHFFLPCLEFLSFLRALTPHSCSKSYRLIPPRQAKVLRICLGLPLPRRQRFTEFNLSGSNPILYCFIPPQKKSSRNPCWKVAFFLERPKEHENPAGLPLRPRARPYSSFGRPGAIVECLSQGRSSRGFIYSFIHTLTQSCTQTHTHSQALFPCLSLSLIHARMHAHTHTHLLTHSHT